ncbi:carotenoid biosynthesis protein [Sanyastnella coralliicola]|uniref:carotenoid biosynthesis protein n=1 Tax=Sanyastnella coralliicola TaxID=3069118 RepID=UPI0027B8F1AF|nr:carotenoid biosynthesis protein [Longitalea sp. SCSIO 12813]
MPKLTKAQISIGVMIILHVVGVCGLSSPWREWFLPLTPLNLMVSGYFVMRHAKSPMKSILFYVFVLAWGVECLGVHTQFPFGEYAYGSALGPQLFEVPILIGLLWLLLLMGSLHLASRVSGNKIVKALISAALMTLLDFLIEPVAIEFNFWTWFGVEVPWNNYAGWFVTALILSFIAQIDKHFGNNKVAAVFFFIQVGFFGILNLLL